MRTLRTISLFLSFAIASHAFSMHPYTSSSVRKIHQQHEPSSTFNAPKTFTQLNLSPLEEDEKENVNVNLVDDVDSFTLTAIGFALIAFNFLVFANMGDAGIGGIVARLINWLT